MANGSPAETQMGRPKSSSPKNHAVKITDAAYEAAQRAAGLVGIAVSDYVSNVVKREADKDWLEAARRTVDALKAAPEPPEN